LKDSGKRTNSHSVLWLCACSCGRTTLVWGVPLRQGLTKSCGCFAADSTRARQIKHGLSGTPEYSSWLAMHDRCRNPKANGYQNYGGRGIKIHPRWCGGDHGVQNFLADMGKRPAGHTLDRIEVNGNYEPGNCRWSTPSQQNRNRRNSLRAVEAEAGIA
jgi:hypothetical protein